MSIVEPPRELFVLGLLRRQPASAYAIDKTLREHSPLYRSFKRGNLYTFVERLASLGLVERERAASQRGPRKTKKLYRLLPKGERRFIELLRTVVLDVQADDASLETALVLLGQLRRDRAVELLRVLLTLFVVPIAYVRYRQMPGERRRSKAARSQPARSAAAS